MPKRKKNLNATSKINPPANVPLPATTESSSPFHLMFPFELQHKDGTEKKTCWFKDKVDMQKYIDRYKLKARDYSVKQTSPR